MFCDGLAFVKTSSILATLKSSLVCSLVTCCCLRQNCSLHCWFCAISFHRRQTRIVAWLVSSECVGVIGMWALTSLLDKFHFMVTFAVHILLNCGVSVLPFLFVLCKPMLLTGFIHKGKYRFNLSRTSCSSNNSRD